MATNARPIISVETPKKLSTQAAVLRQVYIAIRAKQATAIAAYIEQQRQNNEAA